MKNNFLNFLQWILKQFARLTIWRFKPDVIAISGSVGKTSTKEAIFAILSARGKFAFGGKNYKRVRKSNGNFNNELGMPLAILGDWKKVGKPFFLFWPIVIVAAFFRLFFLPRSFYPKILILEYAAAKPGDIKYLLNIAKPKIAVLTAIGDIPVHSEFYGGPEAVIREKSKLIENLYADNFAVLNFDDETVISLKEKTRGKIMTFGFNEGADIRITNFENRLENGKPEEIGVFFKLEYKGNFVPVVLKNVLGKSHAYAAAAAAAIGLIYNLNLVEIAEHLANYYQPAKRRMNLILGKKKIYIIDDSYNASPLSMINALQTLKDLKSERRVAVLGDMLELGESSSKAHEKIGELAAGSVDILITVGPLAKIIAEAAKNFGLAADKIFSFENVSETLISANKLIKTKDILLVKGSRAVGLDKLIDALAV